MDLLVRAPIDDHLSGKNPELDGAVRASTALRAVGVALDQVVNRCNDDIRRWGKVDVGTLASFKGDFDHARRHLDTLEASAKAGRAMLAVVEDQVTKAGGGKKAVAPSRPAVEPEKPVEPAAAITSVEQPVVNAPPPLRLPAERKDLGDGVIRETSASKTPTKPEPEK